MFNKKLYVIVKECLPGMYPKIVKAMFINKSIVHPTSKSTPNGGKITAKMNLKMSEHVRAMAYFLSQVIEMFQKGI